MIKKKSVIKTISFILCLAMLLPLCGCTSSKPVQEQVFAMDTVMTLTAYGKHAEEGINAAKGIITAMDSMLDPDSESSYTYKINSADGNTVTVTPQIIQMLDTAYEVYEKSKGALDLSVYPIYLAWGEFKEETGRVPSSSELEELMENLKFEDIEITGFAGEANYTVRLPAGTQLSFGAAAKGCTASYAIDAMKKEGVESGLVSLGGNVQTLGLKPDGSNWTVAVEDPRSPGSIVGTLSVGETAVVTSGSYQRYFIADNGTKYHHLIDPKTGYPADSGLLSVTVICEDGTLADCLSTAMFILGKDAALNYWRNNGGFEMVMITTDNEIFCTSGLVEVFNLTNKTDYTVSMIE